MPEFTCPTCGQLVQGDECPRCRAASAIAKSSIHEKFSHFFVQQWPTLVVGAFGLSLVVGLVVGALHTVNKASARTRTIHNMKIVAVACHAYLDIRKRFPTPNMVVVKDGKDHELVLSWRVAVLPYLTRQELMDEFDLTAAWDNGKNADLRDQMPIFYTSPFRGDADSKQLTCYQFFTGPKALFPNNAAQTFLDIRDQKGDTFLFAEADKPVIWSRPADMAIRPDEPLPLPADLFHAAMVDGTVRSIDRSKASDSILRQFIDPNDGGPDPRWDH